MKTQGVPGWMSVKHLTLHLDSGHDLMIVRLSPVCLALGMEPALDSLFCTRSLSKKKEFMKTQGCWTSEPSTLNYFSLLFRFFKNKISVDKSLFKKGHSSRKFKGKQT